MAGGTLKQKSKSGQLGRFAVSCRGVCVRVMERRYPGARDRIEIENKWLYVFRETSPGATPELVDEIFAPPRGKKKLHFWRALEVKGKVKSPKVRENYRNRPSGWYQADPKKKTGTFLFFLSPIQIGPNTLKKLQDRIKALADKRPKSSYMGMPGTEYYLDYGVDEHNSKQVINWHSFEKQPAGSTCLVMVPDPFAWAEDLQQLGYQVALELYRETQKDKSRVNEVLVAAALRGAMAPVGGDSDPHKIERHLQRALNWYAHGRSKPPTLVKTKRLLDRRSMSVEARITPDEWEKSRAGAERSVDVRLKMHEIETTALKKTANREAKRLTDWLEGERHRIVEQAGFELFEDQRKYRSAGGPDMLWYLVTHWAKVTFRLGEIEAGIRFQINTYEKESKRVVKMLFKQAESKGNWWDKSGPLRNGMLSTFKLVENFANALSISEGKQFQPFMKKVLGMKLLGFKWVSPDSSKFPRLFGKPIPTSLRAPQIELPSGTKLADAKDAFDKYQVDSWFSGIGIGIAAINLTLALDKIMSGKASSKDKLKAGFDGIALAADIAKLSIEIPMKRAAQLAKAGQLEEVVSAGGMTKTGLAALTRVGAAAGAAGSLIDFHTAVSEFGKEALLNENPEAAMGRVLQATGAAVGFGACVFGMIFGGLVSGPAGWIALAAAGISIFGSWLASHFSRTKWGDIALYSFLGKKAGTGSFYKEYFEGRASSFAKNLDAQARAATGLMASIILELPWGTSGRVRIKPGFIDDRTRYFITWQLCYLASAKGDRCYATIETILKPKEGLLRLKSCTRVNFPRTAKFTVGRQSLIEKVKLVDGRCVEFEIFPELSPFFKQQIAKEVTVFMWIDVYGDGKVTVPLEYDTEFEYRLPDGTKRKLNRHGGLTAGTTRSESTEIK